MATIYYDKDCDLSIIKNKVIGIVGYGSQGHAPMPLTCVTAGSRSSWWRSRVARPERGLRLTVSPRFGGRATRNDAMAERRQVSGTNLKKSDFYTINHFEPRSAYAPAGRDKLILIIPSL